MFTYHLHFFYILNHFHIDFLMDIVWKFSSFKKVSKTEEGEGEGGQGREEGMGGEVEREKGEEKGGEGRRDEERSR